MVYLNRIYTKTGDKGETALGDGTRVAKFHPRILAYGTVDELNAVIGVAIASELPARTSDSLRRVQHDLFDVGADLCIPEGTPTAGRSHLRMSGKHIALLEHDIDTANELLEPLTSFILPGGTLAAAHLHHARTVCRRAETTVFQLMEVETINPLVAIYLNRLSDLLFVLARLCNDNGTTDVLWTPGASISEPSDSADESDH